MALIVFLGLIVLVAIMIGLNYNDSESEYMEPDDFFNKVGELSDSAFNSKSTSTVKDKLFEMEELYDRINNSKNSEKYIHYLHSEIQDVREEYQDRVFCQWQEKADRVLKDFISCYFDVIDNEPSMFSYSLLSKAKTDCIRYYDKYWTLKDPNVPLKISPMNYLKEYLGSNFDQCMQARSELIKKLESAVEEAKPEKKRGEKLTREMISFVKSKGCVKRFDLKNHEFQGFYSEEVAAAYNYLKKNYRLVEYKIGRTHFVCLPEKQQSGSPPAESETTLS